MQISFEMIAAKILIFGLLLNSGYGATVPNDQDYPNDGDDVPKATHSNPVIITKSQQFGVKIGDDLELPCMLDNVTDDSVVWSFGLSTLFVDKHQSDNNPAYSLDWAPPKSNLRIKNIGSSHLGNYSCVIPNNAKRVTHEVALKEPVTVDIVNAKKYVDNLAELSIVCRAKGFPTPTISWYRQKTENSIKEALPSNSENFVISTVQFSDAGVYTCQASNGDSTDLKSITVNVIQGVAPESATVFAGDVENSTRICCVFDKSRKLTWTKDGKDFSWTDRFFQEKDKHKECIVIRNAKESDFGVYACASQKMQEKAEITLSGKPGKPILKSATSDGLKNPVLNWDIISLSPITGYKVSYKKPEESDWKTLEEKQIESGNNVNSISHTFSDLPNGQYDVKLEVSNKYDKNESIESGSVVVDRLEPNVSISAKVSTAGNGAESHFKVSNLCLILVILMRLWSC